MLTMAEIMICFTEGEISAGYHAGTLTTKLTQ